MSQCTDAVMQGPALTIGLDLGDRKSVVYAVDAAGRCVDTRPVATTPEGLRAYFGAQPTARVVLEVGTHSPWVERELVALGHTVLVGNPSAMYGRRRRAKRNDRLDAEFLARQGRAAPSLLHPIRHRRAEAQADLELLRARDALVRSRTALINHVRGTVKSTGARCPRHDAHRFPAKVRDTIPAALQPMLAPLLTLIEQQSALIAHYDAQIEEVQRTRYPVTQRLRQIAGVGPVTALAVVLLIDDPQRFADSRQVGAYFGLAPRLDESSDQQPQLRITKHGDALGRRLLVSAAQYILGPFGPPCALRRAGEALMQRGGPNAKKRAVVAVARKLAVLLHHLWITNHDYVAEPRARARAVAYPPAPRTAPAYVDRRAFATRLPAPDRVRVKTTGMPMALEVVSKYVASPTPEYRTPACTRARWRRFHRVRIEEWIGTGSPRVAPILAQDPAARPPRWP